MIGDSVVHLPVDVSGTDLSTRPLIDLCRSVETVPLGYYPVPDQVAPVQFEQGHESGATTALEGTADTFRATGIDMTDLLVFTHDRGNTIDRIANQDSCDAVPTLWETERIEKVPVPVCGNANLGEVVSLSIGFSFFEARRGESVVNASTTS